MKEVIRETLVKYNPGSTAEEIESLTNFFNELCYKSPEDRSQDDLEQLEWLHYLMF